MIDIASLVMKDGAASIIKYLGFDGSKRYAHFTTIDVHNINSPLKSTDDPLWIFAVAGTNIEQNTEWLEPA